MRISLASALVLAGAVLLTAGPAAASPITVAFSGTIDAVEDLPSVSDGSLFSGASFSGSINWDDAGATDDNPSPTYGGYTILSPSGSMSVSAGSYTLSSSSGLYVYIVDQPPGSLDLFNPGAINPGVTGPVTAVSTVLYLALEDSFGTALASDALAGIPLGLAAWSSAKMTLEVYTDPYGGSDRFAAWGTITELTVIPEPGTAILLGGAVLGMSAYVRRRC